LHADDDPNAHTAGAEARPPAMSEQQMEEMIDNILKDDDFNNDGLIDYSEFIRAQQGRGPA
jgi:Ca2+-binding EF-hand superfamily protein